MRGHAQANGVISQGPEIVLDFSESMRNRVHLAVREPCLNFVASPWRKERRFFRKSLQLARLLSCSEPPCWSLHSTRVSKPTTDSVVEDQQL
jgi:hypothetical protein